MSRVIKDYNSINMTCLIRDSRMTNIPVFAMACNYREDKIAELNALGYGYTENHGK